MNKILVTGASGYIGSHTVIDLIENGFEVISVDNHVRSLRGVPNHLRELTKTNFVHYDIDLCDLEATLKIFEEHQDIKGIIHFAALKAVGESEDNPLWYHRNNNISLLNLLQAVQTYKIPNFLYSSSCSVYGNSTELPVKETTPTEEAESPYARTKQVGEYFLQDFEKAHDSKITALRYFNPAGAHTSGKWGEIQQGKPSNLVPAITATGIGRIKQLTVHGTDYDTRDGSCIRDYIHVMDIAHAHTLAVQHLLNNTEKSCYDIINLGIGEGVSVKEAITAFETVANKKLPVIEGPRRSGDVVAVYADNTKAKTLLGWNPKFGINEIMDTAWKWELEMEKGLDHIEVN